MNGGLVTHGEPPVYLRFAGLATLGLPHATTTRHFPGRETAPGGAGEGAAARAAPSEGPFSAEAARILAPAGLDVARAAWARQVHGADVVRVDGSGLAGAADVLATTVPGLPLVVFTADCLALTLWDPGAGVLALAHAGWRGLVRGAIEAVVASALALGARPERMRAAISPAIGPCCYEVDAPVIDPLGAAYPRRWEAWARPARRGHWMLDLPRAATDLLSSSGIDGGHLERAGLCTGCRRDLLYSYRKGHRGRLCTIAALP